MEKVEYKFTWHWCNTCNCAYIRCPKCLNNCCNGVYGKMKKNGKPVFFKDTLLLSRTNYNKLIDCDVCPLAYQYQELAQIVKPISKQNVKST